MHEVLTVRARTRLLSCVSFVLAGLVLGATAVAAAQVVPPSIREAVDAEYPQAALLANRGPVTVPLRVVIETDGSVSEATVLESLGDGLDEAAVAAMLRYRFEPATRDGVPVRIALRFSFVLTPPVTEEQLDETGGEDAPPEEPPPGRIVGRLLDAASPTALGLGDVDVVLTTPSGELFATRSDPEGRFVFDQVPPGEYRLIVRPLGLPERAEVETVASGEELTLTYRIATEVDSDDEDDDTIVGARAVAEPPPREAARRTLPEEVLNNIPGTRGDPLRAIEILPGIARPPFGLGLVIVRGAAPGDTEILLDGVPIPLLYHFGGLTSVFNGRLLSRIDFYPGNFSSRYGRKMGGIIEVDTRDPRTDRIHGNVELGVIDSSILIEGPLTRRFALAGSFRRSFIDSWFGAVAPPGLGITNAPTYYDYQLLGTWRPNARDRVRFRFYGSDDGFKAVFGNSFADDPATRGRAGLSTRFNFFQTNWRRQMNPRLSQDIVFQTGPTRLQFSLGRAARFDLQTWSFYGRAEWVANVTDRVRVVGGLDVSSATVDISYFGGAIGPSEGATADRTQTEIGFSQQVFNVRPGGYVDVALTRNRWTVNTALRVDYYSEINRPSLDPRVVVNYNHDAHWKIRAGAGVFSQPPEFQESAPVIGNPNLTPIHAAHFGVGTDYTTTSGITLSVDGFYKQLWNRVVQTELGQAPTFVNGGIGRIYGLEVQGRIQPSTERHYYGYLAYTLMRSERRDRDDAPWRLFDYDQTHILTTTFMYQFARHWELGGTVRLISGNPYTPVTGGVFDPIAQSYYPINGVTNSARVALFNRVDIRVQKTWEFSTWKLALFFDVQNATNRQNQETVTYNYDYTRRGFISGLPIIPAFGVRGEF